MKHQQLAREIARMPKDLKLSARRAMPTASSETAPLESVRGRKPRRGKSGGGCSAKDAACRNHRRRADFPPDNSGERMKDKEAVAARPSTGREAYSNMSSHRRGREAGMVVPSSSRSKTPWRRA